MEHREAIKHLRRDTRLKEVIETTSLRPLPSTDGSLYHGLVRAVIYQQLSGRAADAIYARFLKLFDEPPHPPQELLQLEEQRLRSAGLSRAKTAYVRNIAHFFLEQGLEQANWETWEDEALINYLARIKGVGRWTVQMVLMFNLQRPDIFPAGDLGIQQAMARLYGLSESGRALQQKMREIAEPWRPYRSYACRYLWPWISELHERAS